ncbi:hypothetical protein BJX68DRAFT_270942 [Aspergillus pseudodeflectus]|uniref:NmrA-like domain-containing protein n=1 Tax=Aspergillus pseudodeflectus TaxID=176178 RepID=A0ABR4JPN3_9EURO
MAPFRNIALAGASGNLGPAVLSALVSAEQFNITVLTRIGSTAPVHIPTGVSIKEVDYDSVENLTANLKGQDAVISILPPTPGGAEGQTNLIHAAVAANVSRFLPSEFGSDLDNILNRGYPVYSTKVAAQELLKELAAEGKISYTIVYNGAFLDWGLKVGFPISPREKRADLHDGGNQVYSTTTLGTVGRTVVSILNKPEETKNRVLRVAEASITLNELLAIAQEVVGPNGWIVTKPDTEEEVQKAAAKMGQGIITTETIFPFLQKAIWGEGNGGFFQETDNELLEIRELGREDIRKIIQDIVKG